MMTMKTQRDLLLLRTRKHAIAHSLNAPRNLDKCVKFDDSREKWLEDAGLAEFRGMWPGFPAGGAQEFYVLDLSLRCKK